MTTASFRRTILCTLALSLAPGCGALSAKGEEGAARYFSLELAPAPPGVVPAELPAAAPAGAELRLGRVTSAPHLEERMVFRNSAREIGYYRERRWTEPPEMFLGPLLARALFERRGLRQVVSGPGPTLDVQLVALDEIRAPELMARVVVVAQLHDARLVLWEETFTVERAVVRKKGGDPAVATVDALGEALRVAVDSVADQAVRVLAESR
jgi:cholesterol transport system auxiliary component